MSTLATIALIAGSLAALAVAVCLWVPVRLEALWPGQRRIEAWARHATLDLHVEVDLAEGRIQLDGSVLTLAARRFQPAAQRLLDRYWRPQAQAHAREAPPDATTAPDATAASDTTGAAPDATEAAPDAEPPPRRDPPPEAPAPSFEETVEQIEDVIRRAEPFVAPVLARVAAIPRTVRLLHGELTLLYGLGRPDWTGLTTGALAAGTAWLPPPVRVRTIPVWHELEAGAQAHLWLEMRLLAGLTATLRFGLGYLREWVATRLSHRNRRRSLET